MIEKSGQTSTAGVCMSTESLAALALHEDAKQSRQTARQMRRDAQQDRLALMRQTAHTLRAMASSAAASAIWQGIAGLASAACSTGAALTEGAAWGVAGKLADLAGRVDLPQVRGQLLAVDKQRLETQAEAAGHRTEEQADLESEARRLTESAGQLLQKASDAAHAARMAALRG